MKYGFFSRDILFYCFPTWPGGTKSLSNPGGIKGFWVLIVDSRNLVVTVYLWQAHSGHALLDPGIPGETPQQSPPS